jgi:hypothetical protein
VRPRVISVSGGAVSIRKPRNLEDNDRHHVYRLRFLVESVSRVCGFLVESFFRIHGFLVESVFRIHGSPVFSKTALAGLQCRISSDLP